MAPQQRPPAIRRGGPGGRRSWLVALALVAGAAGLSSALLFALAPSSAGLHSSPGAEARRPIGAHLDSGRPRRGSRAELVARSAAAAAEEDASMMTPTQAGASRRDMASAAAFGALSVALPAPAVAEPEIKARCQFTVKIGGGTNAKPKRIVIGLYRDEAPILTQNFLYAVTQSYPGLARSQVTYKLADVKSIEKDKAISWAEFREGNVFYKEVQTDDKRWVGNKMLKLPLAGDDTLTDETNSLRHDIPGRVSMRRGGGSFDFTVSPVADATWLDKTNVVIGQVLEGMDVIAEINKIPMVNGKPLKKARFATSKLETAV